MPEILYGVILLLSVGLTVSLFRIGHYKGLFHETRSVYDSMLDRAMEAERELGHLTEEHDTLKATFQGTLTLFQNRQSVAVMTDAQMQLLSQTISHLVLSQTGANKLPN